MKYDKFFTLAKEAGIEEAELYIGSSRSLSISMFHGEIENYSDNTGYTILARGLINGKCGTASCDVWNAEKAKYLVDEIAANAKVIENEDPIFIFEGSPKYKKVHSYNKELGTISIDEKIKLLHQLEEKVINSDERIKAMQGVEVEYSESEDSVTIINTKGLKLTQKGNYFVYVASAIAKEGNQVKSGYDLYLGNEFDKFNVDELAKKVCKNVISQLGGEACESGNYKAVLSPNVVKSLLSFYIDSADAEEIQKHSSLFIDKLNQKVASSKVTVEDRPLSKNVFAKSFDDEGVATYNKPIIKNGVLQTYLYNLTTAAKAGTTSTGNAVRGGGKMGTSANFLYMKPGKKTQEQLFQEVGNGVYITEVQGLHAGMNPQSGNFSLQSTGYLIKDGKKDRGLDIITISGNLVNLFMDIKEVGNDETVFPSAISCPSVLIKKIAVGGK